MPSEPAVVRAPKQSRSRESWKRVLDISDQLLAEGGIDALSITEVCRRSGISPPSLYARVDGLAGLFSAVYERGMFRVRATEDAAFAGLPIPGAPAGMRAARAAGAIALVFRSHAAFLRPVIGYAGTNPELLERGAIESRRLTRRTADAVAVESTASEEIARTLYAECVVRTMYGADFFTGISESDEHFVARLARTATARAAADGTD